MTAVRRALLPALILVLALFIAFYSYAGQYHIIRVIDGDTIDVDHLNKKFTIRLVGIDAPELERANIIQVNHSLTQPKNT